ncbi:phosphoesterase RecJ domain-containing protein [Treponema bryantii]|uniref:Phosphoesterase RecJ domain-containing protein n=1 Tax=Treponema bryantii TaxID=163 RepID=A0A1H9IAJ4_9SPIR|nr:bifunctional oligoribonuclease/PAP phosphatase NrnA [Treponema bryantii]SEQ71556.1 phosphoesterase RecJ domain-containing protein [Treponema bryantii]
MFELSQEKVQEIRDFIENHNFFFIIGHKEPDGDCITSCLGLAAILDYFGKPYQLLSAGPFKRNEVIRWQEKFSDTMEFQDESERKSTGLFIADCSEIIRLGDIDGDLKGFDTFVIDHHKTSELGDEIKGYVNADAPACAFLVQLFYEALIGPVPSELAKILFFGICTDTGFFRFLTDNSAEVFAAVSRLVADGADPRTTYREINSGKPYSTRKLLGVLLGRAERYLDGRLVVTYETLEDTKKWGLEGRDSDSLYQLMLSAKGVEAVVFLRQDTPTTCTGGFRSQDKIDVSAVAAKFGGGGHKNASGMSCNGKVETLIPQIVKEFARVM